MPCLGERPTGRLGVVARLSAPVLRVVVLTPDRLGELDARPLPTPTLAHQSSGVDGFQNVDPAPAALPDFRAEALCRHCPSHRQGGSRRERVSVCSEGDEQGLEGTTQQGPRAPSL